MPNSEGKKSGNFVWSDDEVELLLNVVPEYKTARTALDLFRTPKALLPLTLLAERLRLQFALRATTEGKRYSYACLYTRCANLASQYLNECVI